MAASSSKRISDEAQNTEESTNPLIVLLFSGKRKSGKDYITDNLQERIGAQRSTIVKISAPIKSHWAKTRNLDISQLLSDSDYKEKYRLDMIKWGEEMRTKDHGFFCRAAIDMCNARDKSIWIVSDIRRKTDVQWFRESFGSRCKTIRVSCDQCIREKRGWIFNPGVDDAESECDLDDYQPWDLEITNNGGSIENILLDILKFIQ